MISSRIQQQLRPTNQLRPAAAQAMQNIVREGRSGAAADETHDGDFGAGDYPFGTDGDRPFVDEAQQAGRVQPWMWAVGGFGVALLIAKLAFGR